MCLQFASSHSNGWFFFPFVQLKAQFFKSKKIFSENIFSQLRLIGPLIRVRIFNMPF